MAEYLVQDESLKDLGNILREKMWAYWMIVDRSKVTHVELPEDITSIRDYAFYGCTGLTSLTFRGIPNTVNGYAFSNCPNLTTINVPWAEGAVAGAPWGATKATINYNYRGDE